ncbi:FAD-dependent oxidoreductase [Rhodoligotrophos defluvii]|uniref:FAD-dependent oxidoreductase n=1 Tax=Rhodoligotrophos defluvii TaxID=2561934 RepID=UPI0010C95757|nr:FAD-dependent oxidoreductase [Rhodoligotrophos defluvii]
MPANVLWTPQDGTRFDVVVVGSGSAALAAALTAADGGASVLILEKSHRIGGTSAMSGAGTWIPNNHHAKAAGIPDSEEEALAYLHSASPAGWDQHEAELWGSFVRNAPDLLQFLEAKTPLRFELLSEPDPMAEREGGKAQGRMLSPYALSRRILGPLAGKLRRSTLPHIFTYGDMIALDPYHHPIRAGLKRLPVLIERVLTDTRGQGSALMTGLLKGCIDHGCRLGLGIGAKDLVLDDTGAVIGVKLDDGITIEARRGVVLATGGFEWNPALFEQHFPGGAERIGSPRANTGDGQLMAKRAGAKLDRMDQANVHPCLPTIYEGKLHGLPMTFQAEPCAIVVNARGVRFASEYDYNLGEALDRRDPATGKPANLPAWVIADSTFLTRSLPFRWYALKHKGWIRKAPTLRTLARKIGVPTDALEATVARYNHFARAGHDEDFHRGETVWERYKSKGGKGPYPNPAMAPIEKPPFIALSLNRSVLGTKGGARTNARGQVLRVDDSVIPGLYCAGNAMANPIGTRALGAGTTIGPCMTWGYICGKSLLADNR